MTKFSIVVPFYNVQDTLPLCVESLLSQTFPRAAYEILLVDNNSTDRSAALAARFDSIRVLSEPKQGAYAARNHGIRAAHGEIICFTDPDCAVAPQWLQAIDDELRAPSVQLVLGYRHYGTRLRVMELLAAYEAEKAAFVIDAQIPKLYYGFTNNMAVRRTMFEQLGLFPERKRGGDTIMVQAVVHHKGCDAIRFARAMEIDHLEVKTVRDYYHKRAVFGQSNQRLTELLPYRALSNRERWRVFRRTTRQQKCSPV